MADASTWKHMTLGDGILVEQSDQLLRIRQRLGSYFVAFFISSGFLAVLLIWLIMLEQALNPPEGQMFGWAAFFCSWMFAYAMWLTGRPALKHLAHWHVLKIDRQQVRCLFIEGWKIRRVVFKLDQLSSLCLFPIDREPEGKSESFPIRMMPVSLALMGSHGQSIVFGELQRQRGGEFQVYGLMQCIEDFLQEAAPEQHCRIVFDYPSQWKEQAEPENEMEPDTQANSVKLGDVLLSLGFSLLMLLGTAGAGMGWWRYLNQFEFRWSARSGLYLVLLIGGGGGLLVGAACAVIFARFAFRMIRLRRVQAQSGIAE
jgi:hypothetical protein